MLLTEEMQRNVCNPHSYAPKCESWIFIYSYFSLSDMALKLIINLWFISYSLFFPNCLNIYKLIYVNILLLLCFCLADIHIKTLTLLIVIWRFSFRFFVKLFYYYFYLWLSQHFCIYFQQFLYKFSVAFCFVFLPCVCQLKNVLS